MTRIDDCIAFVLSKAYQRVHAELKPRLAAFGLTAPQYAVLLGLWEQDGRSSAQLRERLVMDSATITGVIDRLERNGPAHPRPRPQDRRLVRLRLTDAGRALRDEVQRTTTELNADVLGAFREAEAEDLVARLRTIARKDEPEKSERYAGSDGPDKRARKDEHQR
ncbi:MarR family transcriptional regulator [Streptomyces sp. NPDC005202]|uniref:MarR family winged helix-turn-helix transcriptional regulator n=1 Tax=Streptomyces sp. NPDC005202 TaxID=3157021 RepID=UPI0033ACC478